MNPETNLVTVRSNRCVYFSHGQKLTPEQLNAVNEFALSRSAMLGRFLLASHGIIQGVGEELKVEVLLEDSMSLKIQPGAAINELGEILEIEKAQLLNLRDLAGPETLQYFIQLVPEESLESPFQDDEIPELKGFQYRRIGSRIEVSKEMLSRGVEVARVKLNQSIRLLKTVEPDASIDSPEGVVDSRHASKVRIYSANQINFEQHTQIRRIVREFRTILLKLGNQYTQLKELSRNLQIIMLLEAEISEPVFAYGKLQYLLAETKKSLLDLFEEIRDLTTLHSNSPAEFWTHLFDMARSLEKEAGECTSAFKEIQQMGLVLKEKILDATTQEERRILIKESLRDLQNFNFGFHSKHSFGGSLFRLVDTFDTDKIQKRVSSDVEFATSKLITSKFPNGGTLTAKGHFYSEGELRFSPTELKAGLDTIVLLRIYKRRGVKEFNLIFNGHKVHSEKLAAADRVDHFLNIGAVIEGSMISAQNNQLSIQIEKVDLDFGLFGIWIYQCEEGGQ